MTLALSPAGPSHPPTAPPAALAGFSGYSLAEAALATTLVVGGLVAAASAGSGALVESGAFRCFTGTKWAAEGCAASRPFASRGAALFGVGEGRLEPVTVTRYRHGQYQRKHLDSRPAGDASGYSEFMGSGGQRLAQLIVYLQVTLTLTNPNPKP